MATIEELESALIAADAAGNEEDARVLANEIATLQSQPQPDAGFNPAEPTGDSIDPDTLSGNSDWLTASRLLYKHNTGEEFNGEDKDLAEYGLDQMGWFNYNMPVMAVDAARLQYAAEDQKKAFLYLMDTYDDLEMSWSGAGRFIKGAAADPTTYVGLGTLGLGTIAAQGTKTATKQGIKQLLKTSVRGAVIGGVEGAVYGAAGSAGRQSVEVAGGARESISGTQLALDAAVSGVGGAVFGSAIDVAGGAIRNRKLPSANAAANAVAPQASTQAPNVPGATSVPPTAVTPPTASVAPANPLPKVGDVLPDGTPVTSVRTTTLNGVDSVEVNGKPFINLTPNPATAAPSGPKPGGTQVQDVIDALKKAAPDDTVGNVPRNRVDLLKAAEEAYDNLLNLGVKDADEALDLFQTMSRTSDQNTLLKVSTQQAAETVTKARAEYLRIANGSGATASERQDAVNALIKLSPIQKTFAELDAKLSSPSGTDLGSRKGGKLVRGNRNLSPETILREQKLDPANVTAAQQLDAEQEFVRRWDEIETIVKESDEVKAIQKQIETATNMADVNRLFAERDAIISNKIKKEAAAKPFGSRLYEKFNEGFMRKNNEFIISSVFSPTTLVMNTIPAAAKVIYKPALDAAMKGFGKTARAEMFHTYSAYKAVQGAALSGAKAAFRYERALLTGDFDKVLEQGPAIKGLKGRVIRFFPRALAATDEYFSRVVYHGYMAGNAATQATEVAISKGLKGADLDKYVNDAVEKSLKNAYEIAPDKVNTLDLLRQRGMDRGLTGPRLDTWMKAEMDKNGDLFKQALDETGRDFTNDVLFKREFSGKGSASKIARGYERFVNENPAMRFIQLFIRTPIRVFEEGLRLTPGFQFIAPNFKNDLMGRNGVAKQVRAQGEMMLSYSMATGVMGLFAAGAITGGGPTDYKQRRGKEYAKDFEPYTITFPNGYKFSYRNLDPLATPIKIMVNVLERLETLEYRRSQGEKVEGLMANTAAYAQVAIVSGLKAIQDASLLTGIDQIADAIEVLGSEDSSKLGQIEKFFGQKASMYVPSTFTKVQDFLNSDAEMRDPATIEQFVTSRINPDSDIVPRRYNNIGLPVNLSNPAASLFGPYIPSTKDKRTRGLSEKEQLVLAGMSDMERVNNTNFIMPYKIPGIDLDLRRELTKDGRETYWDRVNRYVYENGVTDALAPLFEEEMGTLGTAGTDGSRTEAIRQTLTAYRKAAYAQLMSEEEGLSEEFYLNKMKEAEARAGLYDQQPR